MLLTDYEKMFRFILEDRGFKSAASAARDIGMTRANFNTLLKTRNLIKPSYISLIEYATCKLYLNASGKVVYTQGAIKPKIKLSSN